MLDNQPRAQLCLMLKQYGQAIINEPRRCKSILSDLAPQYRLETNLLIMALEQQVAEELLKPATLTAIELQLERLTQSLHDVIGIEQELAYWAVESWALALAVIQQPTPRQIIEAKPDVLPLPIIQPPSTAPVFKRTQRPSLMLFFASWLVVAVLVASVVMFFLKTKQENRVSTTQTVMATPKNSHKIEEEAYHIPLEQHDAWTENNLGDIYYYGYGVAIDYQKATEWYRKAAEHGNVVGQCNLGFMYVNGYGVTKDYQKAVEWYRKAAEQGNADGQNNLGIMYENGYGVAQDNQQAEQWYRKAVEQGHYGAQQKLKLLLGKS